MVAAWLLKKGNSVLATISKITKSAVDGLAPDGAAPTFLWDSSLPGFGLKCSPRGSKKYVVKYRLDGGGRHARQRWLTLGRHGQLTPDQARKMAQQALASVARGEDPQGRKEDRRTPATIAELWERYTKDHLPTCKPLTRRDYLALWETRLRSRFAETPISELSRSDVDGFHKSMMGTPYRANRALALLSRLMSLAESWDLRSPGSNPCRQVKRFKEQPRSRYLVAAEIEMLGRAMREMCAEQLLTNSAANAIKLLLLTGARLSEILRLEWAWVGQSSRSAELPDSKTGGRSLYLSAAALTVLEDQRSISGGARFVFPGAGQDGHLINLRKPWTKICMRAGIEGVRLHDLRHTAASVAVGQGASLPILGRLLGHTQAQTTLRYGHVADDPALVVAEGIGQAIGPSLNANVAPPDEKS